MSIPAFFTAVAPLTIQQRFSTPPQPPHSGLFPTHTNPRKLHRLTFKDSRNNNDHLEATIASWTSSIDHYCKNGILNKAILQFTCMRLSGIEPNHITFVSLLSGCAHFPNQSFFLGPSVHGYARKLGLDVNNVMVGTAVINMYSKFGELGLAKLSFDHMGKKNKVSWNAMMNGYMRNGNFKAALKLFDEMPERDAVSWTVLIDGFVKKGKLEEALSWFQEMQLSGLKPDFVTMVSVLSAVANLGTLGLGMWLHKFILMQHFSDNIRINNSLIDMYCRCGCVELACQIFKKMPKRSLVSWNSIIIGLAVNAQAEEALKYFNMMHNDGFQPDGVSFTGALTACSHAGLVNKGLKLFESMKKIHKITPRIEHYGCIVDLYSRAGRLKEALFVVKNMPMKPNEIVIGSLLTACRNFEDVELAKILMNYICDLDPGGDVNYMLLSNIYAASGSWREASNVRKRMKDHGVQKKPGKSSIEVNGTIHEFVAGDKSHVDQESIYVMLKHLSHELKRSDHGLEGNFWNSYECD